MNEADFQALNEHLVEVQPIFDKFCATHEFTLVDRRSLGRYPRIRIERREAINLWFDLWMELDEAGHRFEEFRRDIPYELSAGAYIDLADGSQHGVRYQKSLLCFSNLPFSQVEAVLEKEMLKHLRMLEIWDMQYLIDNGIKVQLGV